MTIRIGTRIVRRTLAGVLRGIEAALAFLKIVGLGDIAASLGTAVGFVALGFLH